jgi:hypothetical protein
MAASLGVSWSNELVVGQSPVGTNVRTEAEDMDNFTFLSLSLWLYSPLDLGLLQIYLTLLKGGL